MKIQLTHYARKGIYAYICPLTIEGSQIKRGPFINGWPTEGDKTRFHKGQSATVEIDLAKHPSGLYEYKEASGHRTSFGYIEVKDGEIVREWETKEEMMDALKPAPADLPSLEGSDGQVAWAEKIRLEAIRDGILPRWAAAKSTKAKDWIDNKDRIIHWFWAELEEEGK